METNDVMAIKPQFKNKDLILNEHVEIKNMYLFNNLKMYEAKIDKSLSVFHHILRFQYTVLNY